MSYYHIYFFRSFFFRIFLDIGVTVSLEQFGLKTANIGYLLTRTFRNTSQYYGYLSNLTDYFLHSVFYSNRESGGALPRPPHSPPGPLASLREGGRRDQCRGEEWEH